MDEFQEWADKMAAIQEQLGAVYEQLNDLRSELKAAGRKSDATALNEPIDRLARYGRLFSDIHASWTDFEG